MEDRIAVPAARLHLWAVFRITYRPIVAIVAAMATDEDLGFEEALEAWAGSCSEAEGSGWAAARWRSEIAYRILKGEGEIPGSLGAWFDARAREVRLLAGKQE